MDVLKRISVGEQDPQERATNLKEVCLGHNQEEAQKEAQCCISCKSVKCIQECLVVINIPKFVPEVKEGKSEDAANTTAGSSALPAVYGRVCPQKSQCEGKYTRGTKRESISIGELGRFVADWSREHGLVPVKLDKTGGMRVVVISSGPAGLTCAGDLAKMGYEVTIFEALHESGGALTYGTSESRLPKSGVVQPEIDSVRKLGIKMEISVIIGKSVTIDEPMDEENFKAVFISSGAGLPKFMGILEENTSGVFSANEYLTRSNPMKALRDDYGIPIYLGERVAVIDGGSVAMDAVRTVLRLGAEVHIVYGRSEAEFPARVEEVHRVKEKGTIFNFLTNPVEIPTDDNGWVKGMVVRKMELGEPDASGRCRPAEVADSDYIINMGAVVMSLGTFPNPLISSTTKGFEANRWKCIIANESNGKTTKEGVYASGDAVTGAATVILAMEAGRTGARGIDEFLHESKQTKRQSKSGLTKDFPLMEGKGTDIWMSRRRLRTGFLCYGKEDGGCCGKEKS